MIAPHGLNGRNGVNVVILVAEVLVRGKENVNSLMALLFQVISVLVQIQILRPVMKIYAQVIT